MSEGCLPPCCGWGSPVSCCLFLEGRGQTLTAGTLPLRLACMVLLSCCHLQHYLMDKDPAHVDLLDLVEKMLEYIPEQRIPLHEALRHPFFTPCKREMRAMALMSSFDDVDATTTNRTPSVPAPVHEEPANTNTKPPSPPPTQTPSSTKAEEKEKVGVGVDSSGGQPKQNKGDGESSKAEESAVGGSKLIAGVADAPKRWAALPSTNYAADGHLDNNLPAAVPAKQETKLEDTNIMRHLERQAAVTESDKPEGLEDDSAGGTGVAKSKAKMAARRTDSKGEAPVKARRRRRESKQLREKTPPLSHLELAQSRSLDSAQSEGDEGSDKVFAEKPAAASAKMDAAPSKLSLKRPEAVSDLVVSQQTSGQKPAAPSTKLPLLFGTTTIDLTPASPLSQDPPEVMESLGMGHFFNQGTQTPERFYREMCPSPHEFSSIPQQTQEKSTQTPVQFYPPIPTQNVGIDAGQFPEGSSSAHSLDSSVTEIEEPSVKVEVEEPSLENADVREEEPVTVSVMPLPQVQTAGIFLTQGPEEEEEGSAAAPTLNQWQSVCSVQLPESPVCVLTTPKPQSSPAATATLHAPPPAAHTTQPITVTPPQPPTAKTKPSQQPPPPVILHQPQPVAPSSTSENAFEAWIETQNAYEEMPNASVSANAAPAVAATVQNVPPPVAVVGATLPPGRDGPEQQKARAKRRRERRRRPAPVSESSTDSTATPPSTPTLNPQSGAAADERLQASEQGKKKAPLLNASACEGLAQTKGGNPQAGQTRGDKQAGAAAGRENGVHSGGRSARGDKQRQASDADEFVLAAESLGDNAR